MPSSRIFPYGIALQESGRVVVFPAAEVLFPSSHNEWLSLLLVVDSGASISVLPYTDASIVGITPEKGVRTSVAGIGGKAIIGWQHRLRVRLGPELISIPLVFLEDDAAPRVLGRAGIFDRFIVIFEEKERQSAFLVEATNEARAVRNILKKLRV